MLAATCNRVLDAHWNDLVSDLKMCTRTHLVRQEAGHLQLGASASALGSL